MRLSFLLALAIILVGLILECKGYPIAEGMASNALSSLQEKSLSSLTLWDPT